MFDIDFVVDSYVIHLRSKWMKNILIFDKLIKHEYPNTINYSNIAKIFFFYSVDAIK